jgi:carbonic anhydrase
MRFTFTDIIPKNFDLKSYFRYTGSLTTPPCTQGIIWNVFAQTINVSHAQVILFIV